MRILQRLNRTSSDENRASKRRRNPASMRAKFCAPNGPFPTARSATAYGGPLCGDARRARPEHSLPDATTVLSGAVEKSAVSAIYGLRARGLCQTHSPREAGNCHGLARAGVLPGSNGNYARRTSGMRCWGTEFAKQLSCHQRGGQLRGCGHGPGQDLAGTRARGAASDAGARASVPEVPACSYGGALAVNRPCSAGGRSRWFDSGSDLAAWSALLAGSLSFPGRGLSFPTALFPAKALPARGTYGCEPGKADCVPSSTPARLVDAVTQAAWRLLPVSAALGGLQLATAAALARFQPLAEPDQRSRALFNGAPPAAANRPRPWRGRLLARAKSRNIAGNGP